MKTKMLILVLTVFALGACAKKSSKSGASRGARNSITTATGAGSTTCVANEFGAIYDNSINGYTFTDRLIQFTGNSDIGYVESQLTSNRTTGVDVRMTARFVNNQFDAANSQIMIRIFDDKYAQGYGRLDDIILTGQSGSNRGNGQFVAVFQDQYGTVTVEAYRDYNQNVIQGVVYFQNSGQSAQTLGRIWISGCSVVGI